jgi:MoxR-like ATPase
MSLTKKNLEFVSKARKLLGDEMTLISTQELQKVVDLCQCPFPYWLTRNEDYRVARGTFIFPYSDGTLPKQGETIGMSSGSTKVVPVIDPVVESTPVVEETVSYSLKKGEEGENKVPTVSQTYVPFGNFKDIHSVIKSGQFFPTFITGLSGNGKTEMVEQVCAKLDRELFRVNITVETDEDDLIGGFRLINGETVWFDGPVVEAMRRGSVLLLDEVDLASNKIMCLQPVMEGKGIYIKKINEFVEPSNGFNVVATANTKGKGDESGMFMFTGVLNEAFLERFPITIEQDYPSEPIEKKILSKVWTSSGQSINDDVTDFIDKLARWGSTIRKTFSEGAIEDIITTRRLVHIMKSYMIFEDRKKAIEICVNRFDEETKASFLDVYSKIDDNIDPNSEEEMSEGEYQKEESVF